MAPTLRIITFSSTGILVALLQLHFLIVSPCMPCISPWSSFGNHCYLLVTDDKTFDEAEQYCQDLSRHGRPSHLATIMSQEEQDFLVLLIKSKFGEGGKRTWFGYRKDRSSGPYAWIDGSPSGGYTNWYTNRPNVDGDCTEMRDTFNLMWNDRPCNELKCAICKIPVRF